MWWNEKSLVLPQCRDWRVVHDRSGRERTADAHQQYAKRDADWGAIDKRVMEEAVILPGVWGKAVTLRSKNTTNVFVNDAYGMYDYLSMGLV